MTTHYVNFYGSDRPLGYFYRSVAEAENDAKGITKPSRIAVPIEVPDPPHVWKIGDWFVGTAEIVFRIVDITGDRIAYTYRQNGIPYADDMSVDRIGAFVPCDPPEWWLFS